MRAFSLVELSIVLVILGLLTGGVLTGQSLIRAAELRAVVSEYERYRTAAMAFRGKYMGIPGDLREATRFWGHAASVTDCTNRSGTSATAPGTCDGDGSGIVGVGSAASASSERYQFWRQLALASLIEGSFTGIAGPGDAHHTTTQNAPSSRLGNGAWTAQGNNNATNGDTNYFNGDYGNNLMIGTNVANASPNAPILRPEEAWNIDTKLDDGMPAQGIMVPRYRVNCAVTASGAALTTAAADAAALDAVYNLQNNAIACTPVFRRAY